jgi:uncharacterized SAM-binding protein YcdF (DUF218 family)
MSYAEPLLLLLLAFSVIAWLRLRESSKEKRMLGWALLGLFLLSWPPAEWLFSRPLEFPYPIRPFQAVPGLQAIVVLGGGISPPQYERRYALPDSDTVNHCAMAVSVYKQTGPLPVLGCEGSHRNRPFPSAMYDLLKTGGVPENLIWIEDRSRNTHENAEYGAAILKRRGIQRIVLVTDAQSMRRAAACFRKQGMDVVPAPCEFGQLGFSSEDLLPNWRAIRRNERTLHEVLGLVWYSINGWI